MGGTSPSPRYCSTWMLHLCIAACGGRGGEERKKKITVINRMWWCQTGSRQDALQGCDDASNLVTAAHFTQQLCLNEVSAVQRLCASLVELQHRVILHQLRVQEEAQACASVSLSIATFLRINTSLKKEIHQISAKAERAPLSRGIVSFVPPQILKHVVPADTNVRSQRTLKENKTLRRMFFPSMQI